MQTIEHPSITYHNLSFFSGEYILIKETLGSPLAFAIVWLRLTVRIPAVCAIQRLAIATYLLEPFFPGCAGREDLVPLLKLIAFTCVCKYMDYIREN